MNTRFRPIKYYFEFLMICFAICILSVDLYSQSDSSASNYFSEEMIETRNNLDLSSLFEIWPTSDKFAKFENVYKNDTLTFLPIEKITQPLDPQKIYWARITLYNPSLDSTKWILSNDRAGYIDVYFLPQDGDLKHHQTGKYIPYKALAMKGTHEATVPFSLAPKSYVEVYMRLSEIDNNSILFIPKLFDWGYWHSLDRDPRGRIVLFFEGIFWIMVIYNFIIFCSLGVRAYLYYALYLLCVAVFVLYSVGPMQTPVWGDPILHQHIGHLAFSLINVFYFQFGRSFLNMDELLPSWDKWIGRLVNIKIIIICFLQAYLFLTFNLKDVLNIEFGLLFFEGMLSIALFVALLRTPSVLVKYFVIGSAAVISIGLSLAALGHIYNLQYTFVIFLSTIVIELICFSLGLGYKMRASQRQQLEAEKARRKSQEELNRELAKVNTAFGRFVPKEFLSSIGRKDVSEIKLGDGQEKVVTVMFSDIRSYTTLAEQMTPKENFQFLNAYLGRMGPIIRTHHGFVNQYYGDGIMALFTQSTEDAIKASVDMQKELQEYNIGRIAKNRPPIKIGIGLHTGKLIMGVIGDTLRMEAGVVSDTVNTAARMEGLTKFYGASILLSEDSLPKVNNLGDFQFRYLGKVLVKGKKHPSKIYDFFGGETPEVIQARLKTKELFEEGLVNYYQQKFVVATRILDSILEETPDDLAAKHYRDRSAYYLTEGTPEGWTGIEQMLTK